MSINDNIKFLENLAQSFKRVIYWNKYKSEITTQLKTTIFRNIYSTFRNIINRLLVLSFKNGYNVKYYMSLAEIKDFNALINNKLFFYQIIIKKQEAYKKLAEISKNMII